MVSQNRLTQLSLSTMDPSVASLIPWAITGTVLKVAWSERFESEGLQAAFGPVLFLLRAQNFRFSVNGRRAPWRMHFPCLILVRSPNGYI